MAHKWVDGLHYMAMDIDNLDTAIGPAKSISSLIYRQRRPT